MKMKKIFFALTLIVFSITATQASKQSSIGHVQKLGDRTINELVKPNLSSAQVNAKFRQLFNSGFSLNAMSKYVLGKHYKKFSKAQFNQFKPKFLNKIVASYASRFKEFKGVVFKVKRNQVSGGGKVHLIPSIVRKKSGKTFDVRWRVYNAGSPRIIDVIVEGVSLLKAFRDQYNDIVTKSGPTGLLSKLK